MTSRTIINSLKITSITIISLSLLNFSSVSRADNLDRLVTSLCESAKTDDRTGMRKKLKSAKIRLRNIYTGINCGPSGSLLRVATSSDSLQAATFIATKIGKKNLSSAESDGKNIVQWTESLGDSGKQSFIDLYNSKMK
jgi:hypothetical protein